MPHRAAFSAFRETVRIDQTYYPETLAHLFLINCPWTFRGTWKIIKPWIDPKTREKFHALGKKFQKKLLEYIPAEELPVEYGGTNSVAFMDKAPRAAGAEEAT